MLKQSDREKLQDCLLLIQSARSILSGLRTGLMPALNDLNDMMQCFDDADRTLSDLLRS